METASDYIFAVIIIGGPILFVLWRLWWTIRVTRRSHSGW
jgi:hypothetical protein